MASHSDGYHRVYRWTLVISFSCSYSSHHCRHTYLSLESTRTHIRYRAAALISLCDLYHCLVKKTRIYFSMLGGFFRRSHCIDGRRNHWHTSHHDVLFWHLLTHRTSCQYARRTRNTSCHVWGHIHTFCEYFLRDVSTVDRIYSLDGDELHYLSYHSLREPKMVTFFSEFLRIQRYIYRAQSRYTLPHDPTISTRKTYASSRDIGQ